MSEISFNDENQYRQNRLVKKKSGGLTGFIIKNGLAKDANSASKVLIVMFVVIVILILGVNVLFGGNEATSLPEPIVPGINYDSVPQ